LYWLGFRDVALFIKEPGVPPSLADLQKVVQYAKEGAPALAVAVSGEALKIVDNFRDKINELGVQPKVVIADFSTTYLSTLEYLAKEIAAAQQPAAQRPSTAQQSQPAAQSPNVSGGVDAAVRATLVVVVVIAAAIVAIALRGRPKR